MRNASADVSPSRNQGLSLVEVAVAVALLSIATAFSLPRFHRLASHEPSSAAAASSTTYNFAPSAYTPPLVPGVEPPSAAVKVKLMDLIRGHPVSSTGSVLANWGGFASASEPNSSAIANIHAPSGGKCTSPDYPDAHGEKRAAGAQLRINGC